MIQTTTALTICALLGSAAAGILTYCQWQLPIALLVGTVVFSLAYYAAQQNVNQYTSGSELWRFLTQLVVAFVAPTAITVGGYHLIAPPGIISKVVFFVFGLVAFAGLYGSVAELMPENVPARGADLLTPQEAQRRIREAQKQICPSEGHPRYEIGSHYLSRTDLTYHVLYLGVSGSGKSLMMRALWKQLLSTIRTEPDTRALIYDEKPDVIPYLVNLGFDPETPICRILNPYDKRSWAWDIARDTSTPSKAKEVAKLLFPTPIHVKEPFFIKSAQAAGAGVMTALHLEKGTDWDLYDLVLAMQTKDTMRELLSKHPETAKYVARILDIKEANSIVAEIAAHIDDFEPIAAMWRKRLQEDPKKRVSMEAWSNGRFIIVLGNYEPASDALKNLNQTLFTVAMKHLLAKPDVDETDPYSRRAYIILDEARKMGRLNRLADLAVAIRSKGGVLIAGFQDIEGWNKEYPNGEGMEIINNFAHLVILRLRGKSAEFAAQTIGRREELIQMHGTSYSSSQSGSSESASTSEQYRMYSLVMPEEIQKLPLANPANGVSCYLHSAAFGGTYYHNEPWQTMMQKTAHAKKGAEVLDLRDEEDERFTSTDDDYRRLGITPPFSKQTSGDDNEEPRENVLDFEAAKKTKPKSQQKRKRAGIIRDDYELE